MTHRITWERITSIEYMDCEPDEWVYDFTVDPTETFATANGIVVHNTLNTFHQCGTVGTHVTQGVQRIRELIEASKNIKTPCMTVYLQPPYNHSKEKATRLAHQFQMLYFETFVQSTSIWYDLDRTQSVILTEQRFWNQLMRFKKQMGIEQDLSPWVLRIEINPLILLSKHFTMFDIYKFVSEQLAKKHWKSDVAYTDENEDHLAIFISVIHKNCDIVDEHGVPITNADRKLLKRIEDDLLNQCLFSGVSGIEKVIVSEINTSTTTKEFVLHTRGSNLLDICQYVDIVDSSRTISNDVHDVYQAFGVECARQVLKQEKYLVLGQSGVDVDEAHVDLLVDRITANGSLVPMNRYGMPKWENGTFSTASLEKPDEHFTDAAVHNISDRMNSVASNLTFGQTCAFGTGLVELELDHSKLDGQRRYEPEDDIKTNSGCLNFQTI